MIIVRKLYGSFILGNMKGEVRCYRQSQRKEALQLLLASIPM